MGKSLEVNRAELARVFGVSKPTIDSMIERGLPVLERGRKGVQWRFDLAACVAWRISQERKAAEAAEHERVGLAEAERRRAVAEARLKEIALDQQLGRVALIEDVDRLWEGRIVSATQTLEACESRLANAVYGLKSRKAIRTAIRDEINAARVELAEWDPDADPDLEEPED